MSDVSRRRFLQGVGASAAVVGVAAVAPTAVAAASTTHRAGDADPDATTGALVAYVEDASTGRISVMSGDREVVVTDRRLAQSLARLAD
jgi:hypothetical protein